MPANPAASESRPQQANGRDWPRSYAKRLTLTDLAAIVWTVIGTQIVWFGTLDAALNLGKYRPDFALNYTVVSLALIAAWMVVLAIFGTRDRRIVGSGSTEYKRIIDATIRLFGVIAIVAFLFKLDLARGYILTSLPVGLASLLATRWLWRQWLGIQRLGGRFSSRVLLVGSSATVATVARELARQPHAGYLVVGACIPGPSVTGLLPGTQIPIAGDLDELHKAIESTTADTVVVTSSDDLPPDRIRELSWSLEPGRHHLVLAPSLTDVGGPRIHMRPVAGLPLIHVETPQYEGRKRFAKRAFDLVGSSLIAMIFAIPMAVIAVIVRSSGSGPILFRQERVGLNGERFRMLKFRTMVHGAEDLLGGLKDVERAAGNQVLFKMPDDPRVTPVGRFMRRFSLDELPQVFNVLAGDMSLVGPRPPLATEVAAYETRVHRRFLVKPGLTGLWQVSGRSNLSWDDSVRLDLYYVENWSITNDLVILWRTLRAVLVRDGAY